LVPENRVLLISAIENPSGYWTEPNLIRDIDLKSIQPYLVSVDPFGSLTVSIYRKGSPNVLEDINPSFFSEFKDCVQRHSLANIIGFQVKIEKGQSTKMIEFAFPTGTMLLKEEYILQESMRALSLRDTGWTIAVENGHVDSTTEQRCVYYEEAGHVKITVKNFEKTDTSDVKQMLSDVGILLR
jgi:hypothetical protein